MRPISIFVLVVATACGSVHDRPGCSTSTDCAAGTYCAHTSDGDVCWPDTVAPAVRSVSVTCGSPCLRDGTMHVTADVTDDTEVSSAEVALVAADLATSIVAPMQRSGALWAADVPLARFPMPSHFERGVRVTVRAQDSARNPASVDAAGVTTVTRLRFQRQLEDGVALTAPAVMADGTVVVAGSNHRTYFVSWDGATVSSVSVGTLQISAAPLVLGQSVWIGSEDWRLYEVINGGSGWQPRVRCDTTRPIRGALAASGSGYVFATSDVGRVFSASSSPSAPLCSGNSSRRTAMTLGPVIDYDGTIYAVSGTSLRRLVIDENGVPDDDPAFAATTLGAFVFDPIVANTGALLVSVPGSQGRLLRAAVSDDQPQFLGTTQVPSGGAVVLNDGAVVLPAQNQKLSKWPALGGAAPVWESGDLGGNPRTPLCMSIASGAFVVATDNGYVNVLRSDGSVGWSRQLSLAGAALQPANLYTPPAAQQVPGATLSTAYFAGADGYLHAVIVDGALDASAPWPKAFHDPRNTNRAGAQP